MNLSRCLVIVVVCLCVAWSTSAKGAYTATYVFGDSLSDVGNVYLGSGGAVPASPPHYDGRFSNGPVWVEYLATALGTTASTPAIIGGTNYAVGGAKTADLISQINPYLSSHTPAADECFVIWAGGNDLRSSPGIDVSVPVGRISGYLTQLAGAGAEEFLVPNLPPLGQIPGYVGTPSETVMDNLTMSYNTALESELESLENSLSVTIHRFDVFSHMQRLLDDPTAYGFTNVTDRAYNGVTVVPNPDEYVFWDDLHPTAAAHAWLGDMAILSVLDPLLGDTNFDGVVDAEDASRLALNWKKQTEGRWSEGDFNLDGAVDERDASILASHWTQIEQSAPAVPEPSALVLLATGLVIASISRRRLGRAAR